MTLVPPSVIPNGSLNGSFANFPGPIVPFNNITPFTYRDGLSFAELWDDYRKYLQDIVFKEIPNNVNTIIDAFNKATIALGQAMDEYKLEIAADREAFIVRTSQIIATMNQAIADNAAAMAAAEAAAAGSASDSGASAVLSEQWAANTKALQDAAVEALTKDSTSKTNAALIALIRTQVGILIPNPYTKPPTGIPSTDFDAYTQNVINNTLWMDGSTTTPAINNFLSKGGYRALRGKVTLTGELRIPSNTTVDATGATITGYPGGNLLFNLACVPERNLDAVKTTAGSGTITVPAGNFTAADVGKPVQIINAGPNSALATAPGSMYGTIISVANATTVTLSTPAVTSITGAWGYIYPGRDVNIELVGGKWLSVNKNQLSQTLDGHGFRLRRIDNLRIHDMTILGDGPKQQGGQYAISCGDTNRVMVDNVAFVESASDGLHFQGPATGITVNNITGLNTGDDLVAFTGVDGQSRAGSLLADCEGDITDVDIHSITGYGVWTHLKVTGGSGPTGNRYIRNFKVDGVYGNCVLGTPINIVDYAGNTRFSGEIHNVYAVGSAGVLGTDPQVITSCERIGRLTIDGVYWPDSNGAAGQGVVGLRGRTIGHVSVKNVHYAAVANTSTYNAGAVKTTASRIGTLDIDGTYATEAEITNFNALIIGATTYIDDIRISNHRSAAIAGNAMYILAGTDNNLPQVSFNNIDRDNGSLLDGEVASKYTMTINAVNCNGGTAWTLLRSPAVVNISGCVQNGSGGAGIRVIGAGASPVVISVDGSQRNNQLLSRDGGQTVRVKSCLNIGVDASNIVNTGVGDIVLNSHPTAKGGNGLCVSNGVSWKNLYTGATGS